jgi:hypothetical protein
MPVRTFRRIEMTLPPARRVVPRGRSRHRHRPQFARADHTIALFTGHARIASALSDPVLRSVLTGRSIDNTHNP